jgi:V8-like Glu-specific endopeptidase
LKTFIFVLISLISHTFALPVGIERPQLTRQNFNKNIDYNFEGIVKLSNCSGSLIKYSASTESDKAIVLTNGHCIQKPGGFLNPGEVWFNRPLSRKMRLFNSKMDLFPITSTKIIYATMTNTDIALYELTESYAEIKSRTGISPLILDDAQPAQGQPIEIISGYWDRGYKCEIDGFVDTLKEGDWIFTNSIRYSRNGCDTIGGTSGSPIIAAGTRSVIAINNTSNESGDRCTLNNPCEVNANGEIYVEKGLRYGQQTYDIYSCLNESRSLDLSLSQCQLPKP